MDRFENKVLEIRAMPPFEQVQEMAKYRDMCICPVCPNHNSCANSKHEWFYCFTGRISVLISKEAVSAHLPGSQRDRIETRIFLHERY